MKKMYSKISLILALIIGILTVPFSAFAADGNSENLVRENTIVTDKFIDENLVGTVLPNRIVPFNNQGESQVTSGYYRFQFIKNYTIKSKKIDVYKYNVYQYSYYVHDPQYSLSHKWVKI